MDREKVIKGLEVVRNAIVDGYIHEPDRSVNAITDAITLLKEQEAVEPEQVDVYGEDEWWGLVCVCPDCKTEWMTDKDATHFCPNCGRPVKWE